MEWLEICFEAPEGTEALADKLEALGVEGLVIEDGADFARFMEENRQYWDYVDEALEKSLQGTSRVKFYLSEDRKSVV